ncbi:hypothetical protein [Parathalassolituus penaei]|uniref:Uncharacterized protein n=1 Tax=Parathalassolituus penaei TaxID=2997323 RepID=A0A9X3ECD6_9GAMM|nr:hypothetical protein [Parathalassolituus penaei]MCY0964994.1 hypothetical protein [Parathalassolituus penaei]
MANRWISAVLLALAPACMASTGIEYQQTTYAWTGPMGVLALVDDWSGDLHKGGEDGFAWDQRRAGVFYNSLQVSYVYRLQAQYRFPWQAAQGYYQYVHQADLAEENRFQTRIEVEHYQGEGPALAYRFEGDHWYLTPEYNQLNIYKLYWGSLEGELYYQNQDNWGGDIQLDYGYTDDAVVRRELDQRSYGTLHGLNLSAGWEHGNYKVDYQGYNLLARIDWPDMPYTSARVCTDCTFFLYGYEYFQDRVERPARVHWVYQQYQWNPTLAFTLNTLLNPIHNSWQLGADWLAAGIHWQGGVEANSGAIRLGLQQQYVRLGVMAEPVALKESRTLQLDMGLRLAF